VREGSRKKTEVGQTRNLKKRRLPWRWKKSSVDGDLSSHIYIVWTKRQCPVSRQSSALDNLGRSELD
jgi:hypothetical protein